MKTYYNILNIPRDTSLKEAKSAYIKLVKQYHPDFNNGSKESERKIKEINNAFQQFKDNYTPTNNQKQEEFRYQSYTDDLMVFFFNKDFEGAVRYFENYEKGLSEDSYSLYIYIISLDKIGETSRAINIFNKYESIINKDESYINQYLSILNRSENYRETEIIFNKYESMLTKNPFSITKYIYALSRLEKYKELWDIFKKYESILSTHDFAISKYINALKRLREYKGLIHVYEKYEESVYLNEYAISDYIYALRKTENYTRIIEVLQDYRYVSCLRNNRFLTSTYLYALKVKKEYTLIWETFEEYQSILKGDRYAIYYYLSALSKIATDVSYAKLIIAFEKYKKIVDNIFCIREYFIALNKSDTLDHYKKVRKLYENDYSTLLKTDNFCTRCYVYACEQIRGFENT